MKTIDELIMHLYKYENFYPEEFIGFKKAIELAEKAKKEMENNTLEKLKQHLIKKNEDCWGEADKYAEDDKMRPYCNAVHRAQNFQSILETIEDIEEAIEDMEAGE